MGNAGHFRDFGINPREVGVPPEHVRCFMPGLQAFGQYAATVFIVCGGIVLGGVIGNALGGLMMLLTSVVGGGLGVFLATLGARGSYGWVECSEGAIRAKSLYTRKIVERSIREILELRTILYPTHIPHLSTAIAVRAASKWLGAIRGVEIRYRDGKTPMQIMRVDPKMAGAQELLEAIVYWMDQTAPLALALTERDGHSVIRSIYWEGDPEPTDQPSKLIGTS